MHRFFEGRSGTAVWLPGVAFLLAILLLAIPASMAGDPPDAKTEARRQQLAHYGGGATMITARLVQAENLMGKDLDTTPTTKRPVPGRLGKFSIDAIGSLAHNSPTNDEPQTSANNVAIRDYNNVAENEPTVVVNPKDSKRLVAGTHFIGSEGNRCVAHYSRDGGKTWNPRPIFMRHLTHESDCSDPVLAYAPDGSRVYYAYMDIKFTHYDILVMYSDDDGRNWKGPVVALANVIADYDKPWIGTHVSGGGGSNSYVYISATRFDFNFPGPCHIDFTRSSNKGATWSAAQTLDTSGGGCGSGPSPVVQGSRPIGGKSGDVVVAWFNSGADGWLTGTFQIRTRYSSNNGATFGPIVVASNDLFELPFYLGPFFSYHRWWGAMFPDVEIDEKGAAHVAYVTDPVAGTATAEDGDIRYVRSAGPPYATWSLPTTVNNDASGKAQGWVALEARAKGGKTTLWAIWEDHRTSANDNEFYDVFSGTNKGAGWVNEKLTDAQSPSDFLFLGDYYDITVASSDNHSNSGDDDDDGAFVYGVWTDRRLEPSIFDFNDDIWGARVPRRALHDDDDDHDDD